MSAAGEAFIGAQSFCGAATNFLAAGNLCSGHELNMKPSCGLSAAKLYVIDMLTNFRREPVTAFN
jgi:hypothetical protein